MIVDWEVELPLGQTAGSVVVLAGRVSESPLVVPAELHEEISLLLLSVSGLIEVLVRAEVVCGSLS